MQAGINGSGFLLGEFRCALRRVLQLTGSRHVQLLLLLHGRGLCREHVREDVVETTDHLRAVLPEPLVTESAYGTAETTHLRLDPCRTDGHRLFWMRVAHFIDDLLGNALELNVHSFCNITDKLETHHNLGVTQIPRVRDERPIDGIDDRLLDYVHMSGSDEAFGPFRNGIRLADQPLAEQPPVTDLPLQRVLGEDVLAVRVGIPAPEGLRHLVPGEVEDGRLLEEFRHLVAKCRLILVLTP